MRPQVYRSLTRGRVETARPFATIGKLPFALATGTEASRFVPETAQAKSLARFFDYEMDTTLLDGGFLVDQPILFQSCQVLRNPPIFEL